VKEEVMKKEFKELTITDDFMFTAVFGNPKNIAMIKRFIEVILGREIEEIRHSTRQAFAQSDVNAKAVRFDVLLKGTGIWIDLEMQNYRYGAIEMRARYYHSLMDVSMLASGDDYRKLGESIVIFICTFDPFHKGDAKYVDAGMIRSSRNAFNSGNKQTTIYLNTTAKEDSKLGNLLSYFENEEPVDSLTEEIHAQVEEIREDPEVRRAYMTLQEKIDIASEEGRREGIALGENKERLRSLDSVYTSLRKKGMSPQ
jgi:predicted transposase/invertase (TIGR01784 family)